MPSSIYDLLETRGVSLEQAEVLDLASDIASGLAYIHGQRLVQRCPSVIMLPMFFMAVREHVSWMHGCVGTSSSNAVYPADMHR